MDTFWCFQPVLSLVGSTVISISYRWCSIYIPYMFHICSIYIPILYRYGIYMEHYWIMNLLLMGFQCYDDDIMQSQWWEECVWSLMSLKFEVWGLKSSENSGSSLRYDLKGLRMFLAFGVLGAILSAVDSRLWLSWTFSWIGFNNLLNMPWTGAL